MNKHDYNTITVFKYFISFLEVWKEENYGQSAEINWQAVWEFVNASHLLDFNDELTDLVNSSPEELEENVHKWIENRILNDEPIYLLFNMSDWLFKKLEEEHNNNIERAERKRFADRKCYKCKYWNDYVSLWIHKLGTLHTYHVGECEDELWKQYPIHHLSECKKQQELVDNIKKAEKHYFFFEDIELSYKPFNDISRSGHFYPNPENLTDCPYFEDTGITYEEYIKKYKELY